MPTHLIRDYHFNIVVMGFHSLVHTTWPSHNPSQAMMVSEFFSNTISNTHTSAHQLKT